MANFSNRYLVEEQITDVALPRFALVRQHFPAPTVTDFRQTLQTQLTSRGLLSRIRPGQRIAITAGSRQIANMPQILRAIGDLVKAQGAAPFLIPAMGSHGGATAQGQADILSHYGITEASTGCPIRSCMDTDLIGYTGSGLPVYCSRTLTREADGIILCNRVKPHPGLVGPIQSGLTKMSVIGCGKQRGAAACHRQGLAGMEQRLLESSKVVLEKMPVLFGVAILENAYDETAELCCVPAESIHREEPELLRRAFSYMPSLRADGLDVLFVDEVGKNLSGVCADPAITLRYLVPEKIAANTRRPPSVFVTGDLTEESRGSASGIGQADIITQRLYEKIDFGKTYVNAMTSTFLANSRMPIVMPNDRLALQLAIRTCNAPDPEHLRIIRIQNTLRLSRILVSEALLPELRDRSQYQVLSEPAPLCFDAFGNFSGPF